MSSDDEKSISADKSDDESTTLEKPVLLLEPPPPNSKPSEIPVKPSYVRPISPTIPLPKTPISVSDTVLKFNVVSIDKVPQGLRPVHFKTDIVPLRSYTDIQSMMNEKFGFKEGDLSTTLDIVAVYLRGQKALYLEAKSYCEFYLHRLMMPCIFISSVCSVISGIFNDEPTASKIIAGATAFNAFLMSIISYFKLDARAEAHKMTSYSFDQMISQCEFTSGKILLSNPGQASELAPKDLIKYDMTFVQNFINDIESKVKEVKAKNQFIIPDKIQHRYSTIYHTNIFVYVKHLKIDEMKLLNQLKVITNEYIEIENKIIQGEKTSKNYELLQEKAAEKNKFIETLMDHRKEILQISRDMLRELRMKRNSLCKLFVY